MKRAYNKFPEDQLAYAIQRFEDQAVPGTVCRELRERFSATVSHSKMRYHWLKWRQSRAANDADPGAGEEV